METEGHSAFGGRDTGPTLAISQSHDSFSLRILFSSSAQCPVRTLDPKPSKVPSRLRLWTSLSLFNNAMYVWWVKWDNHDFYWLHAARSCLLFRQTTHSQRNPSEQAGDVCADWLTLFSFVSFCIRDKTGFLQAQSLTYPRKGFINPLIHLG